MIRKGRKHKRGDRGSLEEEPTDSKRANMAAAEGGNEGTQTEKPLEATEEPSLSELREMGNRQRCRCPCCRRRHNDFSQT